MNTIITKTATSCFTRFCAFALAHIALLCPLAVSAAGGGGVICGPYLYTVGGNGATIINFDSEAPDYFGELVITNELGGYAVTGIYHDAFDDSPHLTAVTIPDTVTTIGYRAFANCTSLASVTIPNSVTNIDYGVGHGVFQECPLLTNITVAADNPNYASSDGVLFDHNITTLLACPNGISGAYTIPDGVTTIVDEAFRFCSALTSVTIPNSVAAIGEDAFEGCTALTNITVAADNPAYASRGGVLFNQGLTTLLTCPAGFSGAYTIPSGVITIADYAFYNRTALTAVTLPDTVTTTGEQAFGDCTALTSVTIPNGVTTISFGVFNGCTALPSTIIPGSVRSLAPYTFGNCTSLASVLFTGDAPTPDLNQRAFVFSSPTIYYLPNTMNWGPKFCGRPAVLWNPAFSATPAPQIDASGAFAFTLTGNTNIPVRIEACTNLVSPLWITVTNATVSSDGTIDLTDPDAATHPSRFYRFTFPR